jgi:hypothetical protein
MKRIVKYAKTQTALFMPGAGELGSVFPSPAKTLKDLHMELSQNDSLVIHFTYVGKKFSVLVPSANVTLALFSEVSESIPANLVENLK